MSVCGGQGTKLSDFPRDTTYLIFGAMSLTGPGVHSFGHGGLSIIPEILSCYSTGFNVCTTVLGSLSVGSGVGTQVHVFVWQELH